jgi:hypothetical protein
MDSYSKHYCITLHSEVETREHEEKVNKYQAVLAARLKAKYFSGKAFGKGTSALQSYDNSMAWHIMVYRRFACLFRQSDICLVRLSFFFLKKTLISNRSFPAC